MSHIKTKSSWIWENRSHTKDTRLLQHTATHCNTLQHIATHKVWANKSHTKDTRPLCVVINPIIINNAVWHSMSHDLADPPPYCTQSDTTPADLTKVPWNQRWRVSGWWICALHDAFIGVRERYLMCDKTHSYVQCDTLGSSSGEGERDRCMRDVKQTYV